MEDINKPITKETTIVQGCSTGHHEFNKDNAMVGLVGGRTMLRLKCVNCGAEKTYNPTTSLGDEASASLPGAENDEAAPDHTVETVPAPEAVHEPMVPGPSWAEQVQERYKQDKNLDDFWANIKESAKK